MSPFLNDFSRQSFISRRERFSPEVCYHCIAQKSSCWRSSGIGGRPLDHFFEQISPKVSTSCPIIRLGNLLSIVGDTSTQERVDHAENHCVVLIDARNLAAEVFDQACNGLDRGWNPIAIGMAIRRSHLASTSTVSRANKLVPSAIGRSACYIDQIAGLLSCESFEVSWYIR